MDTGTQIITLRRFGQFLQVSPPCEELRAVPRTTVHVPRLQGQSIVVGSTDGPLHRETVDLEQPVLEFFMGLLPVADLVLAGAGYKVVKNFALPVPLPAANVADVSLKGSCDTALLELIRLHDRGLIRYVPAAVEPARLIAQVAMAWPDLSVAVAVTRIDDARRLRRQLSQYLPGVVAITSRDSAIDDQVARIVVASYNALGNVEIEKRDIVIALNAVEASRPGPLSLLGYARRARMYGLLPIGQVARQDHDAVRLMFGFEEVEIHRHGVPATQIEVIRLHSAGGPEIPEQFKAVKVKQFGIWNNQSRNRRIGSCQFCARSITELDNGVVCPIQEG